MAGPIADFDSNRREIRDDETIVEYYINLRQEELSEQTKKKTVYTWVTFHKFLTNESISDIDTDPKEKTTDNFSDIDKRTVLNFISWYRNRDSVNSERSVKSVISSLSAMVGWFNSNGLMQGNPFKNAIDTDPFGDTSPAPKIHVPVDDLRNGISDIIIPARLYIVMMLLKTGLRISELSNLDERDIHLDHPIESELDDFRPELVSKPDSIYVDSSIGQDDVINGEKRATSNKENSSRVIPLTSELKSVVVWYLSLRQIPHSDANPILTRSARGGGNGIVGQRRGIQSIRYGFNQWADEHGWYSENPNSMKPHWCRHWFTTTLRSNLDDSDVEVGSKDDYEDYLRGDVGSDSKDDYIQMNWGENNWMAKVLDDALPDLLTVKADHLTLPDEIVE